MMNEPAPNQYENMSLYEEAMARRGCKVNPDLSLTRIPRTEVFVEDRLVALCKILGVDLEQVERVAHANLAAEAERLKQEAVEAARTDQGT